jgi:hypothetical protein
LFENCTYPCQCDAESLAMIGTPQGFLWHRGTCVPGATTTTPAP